MTETIKQFQPGAILHESIIGAMRSNGTTFAKWCSQNGTHPTTARQATYGISGGERGQALLFWIIEAAGPEIVAAGYRSRILAEAGRLLGERNEEIA